MIDYVKISVRAGNGGAGSGSSQHIKGKRYGKADGGDGGSGGNVYIEASRDQNTLERYRFTKDFAAGSGESGLSRRRKGASAADLVLAVPVGTIVKIENLKFKISDLAQESEKYDLVGTGDRVLVVRGGEGGRGNAHLRDEYGRRPRVGEKGEAGETCAVTLELKLIADVGLIGLPNAGKSTLLAALTAARPKIASYPFTTLEPNLGVLDSSQFTVNSSQKDKTVNREQITENQSAKLIIADIPGLIEGASAGRGLGDLFLRHIERTKILVHLIDISQDRDFWQDYQTIRAELKNYSAGLSKKKEIVVLTKIDLAGKERIEAARDLFRQHRKKVLAISAKSGEGLADLSAVLS